MQVYSKIIIFLLLTSDVLCTRSEINRNNNINDNLKVIKTTSNSNKDSKPTIAKCCSGDQFMHPNNQSCSNSNSFKGTYDLPNPKIYDEDYKIHNENATEVFHFSFGKAHCKNETEMALVLSIFEDGHYIVKDGSLHVMVYNRAPSLEIKSVDQYCIDTFVDTDENGKVTPRLDALVCFQLDSQENNYLLTSVCMCVSCVFILATVAVYCWLPELRNIHGKVLLAYLLSFFVGFVLLASIQISIHLDSLPQDVGFVMSFFVYFFLLAAFFWLNVMCFDIWWTFCGINSSCLERLANMSPRNKFLAYCAYAFGVPAALTVVLAALEFSGLPRRWYLPNIKLQGGFLYGTSKLVYLYGPIIVLYVVNLAFFLLTAARIYTINTENTRVLSGSRDSTTHVSGSSDKQRLFLYVKLFCVMGINWILEVVSSLVPKWSHIWVYTDAYNVLIGVTIFIVFVCKRKILRLMKKRYRETGSDSYRSRAQTSSSRTLTNRKEFKLSSVKVDDESRKGAQSIHG